MRKFLTFCFTFILLGISYSQLNDNLNLIKAEDKILIENRIKMIEESEAGIKIYVNTLVEGEGFQISNPTKSIIINIEESEKDGVIAQLSFSKDFNIEDKKDLIHLALDNSTAYLVKGQLGKYILELISNIEILFESIMPVQGSNFAEEELIQKNIIYWLSAGIFLMLVLIIRIIAKQGVFKYRSALELPEVKPIQIENRSFKGLKTFINHFIRGLKTTINRFTRTFEYIFIKCISHPIKKMFGLSQK